MNWKEFPNLLYDFPQMILLHVECHLQHHLHHLNVKIAIKIYCIQNGELHNNT